MSKASTWGYQFQLTPATVLTLTCLSRNQTYPFARIRSLTCHASNNYFVYFGLKSFPLSGGPCSINVPSFWESGRFCVHCRACNTALLRRAHCFFASAAPTAGYRMSVHPCPFCLTPLQGTPAGNACQQAGCPGFRPYPVSFGLLSAASGVSLVQPFTVPPRSPLLRLCSLPPWYLHTARLLCRVIRFQRRAPAFCCRSGYAG